MTDNQYAAAYRLRHRAYERQSLRLINRVLKDQKRAVMAYIKSNGYLLLSLNLDSLINPASLIDAFKLIYARVGVQEGQSEVKAFDEMVKNRRKDLGISFSDIQWRNYMIDYMLLNAGERISGITENTREKIKFLLALAQEDNLSHEDTVKFLLQEIRSSEFPAFSRARAMAIARTESTTAANAGSLLAGQSLTIQYEKKWVSARDNRTRRIPRDKFDHLTLNGVKVGADQVFIVSGEEMKHPGDPAASKGNVINCRCIVRLTPVYDAAGMPVPKMPTMGRLAVV